MFGIKEWPADCVSKRGTEGRSVVGHTLHAQRLVTLLQNASVSLVHLDYVIQLSSRRVRSCFAVSSLRGRGLSLNIAFSTVLRAFLLFLRAFC